MEKAKVWFVRMSLDLKCSVLACGNTSGQVYLWDMHSLTDRPQAVLSRESPISKVPGKPTNSNITVQHLQTVLQVGPDLDHMSELWAVTLIVTAVVCHCNTGLLVVIA